MSARSSYVVHRPAGMDAKAQWSADQSNRRSSAADGKRSATLWSTSPSSVSNQLGPQTFVRGAVSVASSMMWRINVVRFQGCQYRA